MKCSECDEKMTRVYCRADTPEMMKQVRPGVQPLVLRLNLAGETELDVQPPLCKTCWEREKPK